MDARTRDALATLELEPGASIHDIKKTYRELALIWHPDKVPDQVKNRATAKFTQINDAYQWLIKNPSSTQSRPADKHRQYQRKHAGEPTDSSQAGHSTDRNPPPDDPAVKRILDAARKWRHAEDEGIYLYPAVDKEKAANFIASVHQKQHIPGFSARVNDLIVFYDIDGSGEDGMAITRTGHLINSNLNIYFIVDDIAEVKVDDALFFWREINVRLHNARSFELAGYAGRQSGVIIADIIQGLINTNPKK